MKNLPHEIDVDVLVASPTNNLSPDGAVLWRVAHPCRVRIGQLSFIIPRDFEFDMASVPRFLKPFLDDRACYGIAAAAHDWLYKVGQPKGTADGAFLDLLRYQGIPTWQRVVMVEAVALFGGKAYQAHRRAERLQ